MARASASRYRVTFMVLAVAVSSYSVQQSLFIPVLPTIQSEFHTDQASVTWVVTAYLVSAAVATPILGRLGDRAGKQRILVSGLAAMALGSFLAGFATHIGVLIVARVIQGAGGAVVPLTFGIIRDEFPPDRVVSRVSFATSLSAIGAAAGIVLGGPIVSLLGFHWLFWLPGIVSSAAAVAARLLVPESPVRRPGRVSALPALLLSGWLICLLLALSEGGDHGWTSEGIVGMLAGAALLALAWVVVEHRAESPLIDMAMMRMPAVWSVNLIALTTGFCMFATNAFVPQLVQAPRSTGYGFGVSMTEAGLMQLPYPVGMFAVIVVSGALVRRFGAKAVIMGGSLASGSGVLLIALLHAAKWQIYLGNTLLGLGVGIVFICLSTLTVFSVPPDQTGVASGMMTNIRVIGGSIGTAVTASIVTAAVAPGQIAPETGYVHAFATLGAGFILTAVLTLAIPRTPYAGHVDAPAPAPSEVA
ncbi:MFS transporter [Nocardioides sp. AN3]